jgi:hypothetical protein
MGGFETPEAVATGWAVVEGVLIMLTGVVVAGGAALVLALARSSPLGAGALTLASGLLGPLVAVVQLNEQGIDLVPSIGWLMLSWGVVVSLIGTAAIVEDRLRRRRV